VKRLAFVIVAMVAAALAAAGASARVVSVIGEAKFYADYMKLTVDYILADPACDAGGQYVGCDQVEAQDADVVLRLYRWNGRRYVQRYAGRYEGTDGEWVKYLSWYYGPLAQAYGRCPPRGRGVKRLKWRVTVVDPMAVRDGSDQGFFTMWCR
jgi:hypothetical protein